MKVIVVGAGVAGLTTAWSLARRHHDVVVIDRLSGPGLESSRGSAGQLCYSFLYPFADPALLKTAIIGLTQAHGPLKVSFPPSMLTLQFLTMALDYALQPGLFDDNRAAMLTLAQFSRTQMQRIDQELGLAYDQAQLGLMELASSPEREQQLRKKVALLEQLNIEHQWLNAEQARQQEPGLVGRAALHGAMFLPRDGTGDSQLFCRELAQACAARGVELRYQTEVTGWDAHRGRISGLRVRDFSAHQDQHEEGSTGYLRADQVVLAAGCAVRPLAQQLGLSIPIYPVKGYALTAPILDSETAPQSTLLDDQCKLAISRLGDRVRITGFMTLEGQRRHLREARLNVLRSGFQRRFPSGADLKLAKAWAGFRPMLPDGPPALGRVAAFDNLVLNAGHGTFGWTLAAGCAEVVADLIDEKTPPLDLTAFKADRFMP